MKKKLILGNWKMNGSLDSNTALIKHIHAWEGTALVGVCPPSVYLGQIAALLRGSQVTLGAQDCSVHNAGAYTGENSAQMIASLEAKWCLVGHSERRQYHNESDELVVTKANAAADAGLLPVICVGESLEERESGRMPAIIKKQIEHIFQFGNKSTLENMIIAYEPVWAIGTGKTATPEQAQEVHSMIRELCRAHDRSLEDIYIIYGGSMNVQNVKDLLSQSDIDGGLIGGASLKGDEFLSIMEHACVC